MNIIRDTNTVILAVWALLLGSGLVALLLGQWSMAFVALFTLTLSLTPPLLASRYSLKLPMPFLVATTLFFIGSILLGEAFDFYERLWWWDLALHGASAIGFGLFGFLFVFMLFEGDRFAAPPSAIAFITFCVAMTVGAVWEIFEYGMDNIFGLNMQKSGLDDTMGDIMVDALVHSSQAPRATSISRNGPLACSVGSSPPLSTVIAAFTRNTAKRRANDAVA